jgi:hypothetical protein
MPISGTAAMSSARVPSCLRFEVGVIDYNASLAIAVAANLAIGARSRFHAAHEQALARRCLSRRGRRVDTRVVTTVAGNTNSNKTVSLNNIKYEILVSDACLPVFPMISCVNPPESGPVGGDDLWICFSRH